MQLGPYFPTIIRHNSTTTPDKIIANKHHYHNTICEPGNVATSDHIPIFFFQISTVPFISQQPPVYKYHKADRDTFQKILDEKLQSNALDWASIGQIEVELDIWMDTVADAMNKSISKTSFKRTYQMKMTPEMRQLQ